MTVELAGSNVTDRRSSGFTLLEVLVVVAIIVGVVAAVGGIAPSWRNSLAFRETSSGVDRILDVARQAARTEQRSVALVLDKQRHAVGLPVLDRWQSFPKTTHVSLVGAAMGTPDPAIIFLHDGSSTGGTIELRDGNNSARWTLSWLTGGKLHDTAR